MLLGTLLSIGQNLKMIESLLVSIVFLLEEIWSLGRARNRVLVARSSDKVKYMVISYMKCELIWIRNLLREFYFKFEEPLIVLCDNQATTQIATNIVYRERTKHIEVNCHFVKEVVLKCEFITPYIDCTKQLEDLFSKIVTK